MTAVQIMPGGEGSAGYIATLAGVSLPIDSYAAEPDAEGRLIVSLAVFADSLQIGVPPRRSDLESTRRMETPNQPPVSTWGDPRQPDPRANIPGWQPPPARADAGRGQTGEYPPVSHRRAQ
ncbi:hypothetical protein FHR83_006716 [Actinoplanes campanulatus]|uniref:Uncharacterized protein n=1 Tax=Actinoplanes campanulatus TaxID=113559 RepID=A0A7W5FI15_9ACTN|nr:hypothetical protein [Actinoplanes campanulatus]MBB3099010.1 hypothetical protein [Actinoplanes campanulatus]GGN39447.1 hypothetical protein GCM10010109_67400 [Actinoplanes campanulatus]GID40170.1 hypothetical protein Aca09nite_66760 [Actinoplanes campanulatus]